MAEVINSGSSYSQDNVTPLSERKPCRRRIRPQHGFRDPSPNGTAGGPVPATASSLSVIVVGAKGTNGMYLPDLHPIDSGE